MELIGKWTFDNNTYWWREYEKQILFSCFFRFDAKNNLNFVLNDEKSVLAVDGQLLVSLHKYVEILVIELLTDCYTEPSERQLSKHSSSFKKVTINSQLYKLNYRNSDPIGSAIFAIYEFSRILSQAITENKSVLLTKD